MLHPPFARTAALPPAVRDAGADTGSRHSLQTVYRKTVQRCYTLVVGKYLQTDRPAGRSARARAEGEPFMELRSNIKMLNYARKYLLNDTDNILPFPVRPQKPPRTGRLPTLLPRSAPRDEVSFREVMCAESEREMEYQLRGLREFSALRLGEQKEVLRLARELRGYLIKSK